jgi:hypothetical protein
MKCDKCGKEIVVTRGIRLPTTTRRFVPGARGPEVEKRCGCGVRYEKVTERKNGR